MSGIEFDHGTHLNCGYSIRDFAFALTEVICKTGLAL